MNAFLAGVVLGAALGACAAPSEREEIDAVRARMGALIDASNRRDLDAAVESYCEDAVLMPPQGEDCTGREAIRARYAEMYTNWRPTLGIVHVTTFVDGDRAIEEGSMHGTLEPLGGGDLRAVDDEFKAVLRREDGVWRVAQLSWRPRPRPIRL